MRSHRELNGVRIPTEGDAIWDFGDRRFLYATFRLADVGYNTYALYEYHQRACAPETPRCGTGRRLRRVSLLAARTLVAEALPWDRPARVVFNAPKGPAGVPPPKPLDFFHASSDICISGDASSWARHVAERELPLTQALTMSS